jgi:large subunit ribosomal protein L25
MELTAQIREKIGKGLNSLRREGLLPAVLYGQGKNLSLQVNYNDFVKALKDAGESTLVKLRIEGAEAGAEEKNVLIHDVKKEPIGDKIIHADFYEVSMSEKITAAVPLVFVGEPPAVKSLGGTLVKSINEVEIKALAKDLMREIDVNVGGLATFEDRIEIKDLKVPPEVEILAELDEVVALVLPPRKEEEAAAPAEATEAVGAGTEAGEEKEEEKKETDQ